MKQFLKSACVNAAFLTKTACIGIFSEDTDIRNYLESLDYDSWDVMSYNPSQREICLVLYHKNQLGKIVGNRYISLKIPELNPR